MRADFQARKSTEPKGGSRVLRGKTVEKMFHEHSRSHGICRALFVTLGDVIAKYCVKHAELLLTHLPVVDRKKR
jgi:uncharacterized protein (UPF0218 family)